MSLGSKLTVDGLEGVLYVLQPSIDRYEQVKLLVIAIAKQYACCNSLVFLIEDDNVQQQCASTIALLILQPPGSNRGVDHQLRAQWIEIECLLCSLFVADLGEIKCSLQEECQTVGLCETLQPWVCGVKNNYVSISHYEFDETDDFETVLNAARDWLVTIRRASRLLVRVLYFVDYSEYSVSFVYFFADESERQDFRNFYCCYVRKTVQCNCPDITIDGVAWSQEATIYKNDCGVITEIYDSSNSNCTVNPCLYLDPFDACVGCAGDTSAFCADCTPSVQAQAVARSAGRGSFTQSRAPAVAPVVRRTGCSGCAGRR